MYIPYHIGQQMLAGSNHEVPNIPNTNAEIRKSRTEIRLSYAQVAMGLKDDSIRPNLKKSVSYRDVVVRGVAPAMIYTQMNQDAKYPAYKRSPIRNEQQSYSGTLDTGLQSANTSRSASPMQYVSFSPSDFSQRYASTPSYSETTSPETSAPNTPNLRAMLRTQALDLSQRVSVELVERMSALELQGNENSSSDAGGMPLAAPISKVAPSTQVGAFAPLRFSPPTTPTRKAEGATLTLAPSMSFSLAFEYPYALEVPPSSKLEKLTFTRR